jgi:predicted AAA+ superfamily ATPase
LINEIESCADPQTMNYVFLDEIQEIKEFEHTIIALFEHTKIQFDIYITGSNSHMFSNELATRLTGRTSTLKIYPLSFKELYENINQNEDVQKFLQRYLIQGGLGIMINDYYHRAKSEETAKLIINDTIEKDVTNRHHIIADIHAFRKIIDFVFIHVGRDINSLNVSRNLIGSNISYKTVFNYIT